MRLEEELRQAVKMEAIGRLAGSVAHDFNNILTAIIGYSGILMQQLPERSPEHEKLLQIGRAAARAADLTRQLLAFSRKQILDTEVMNLNEVIVELEKMLKRLIGEDIELVTVLNPALGYVQADASQIEQILMNLAVNARDAMPNGGNLTIETANHFLDEDYCRVHPEVEPGQYVMFAVSDSGRGMEPETLSRCFDPFFTTKQKGGGTGLGLSTVYGIVKQHRGHITVYSEPGHGTIFKVYFPKVEEFREKRPKPPSVGLRPHGKETILVVEDEVLVRNLTREALEMLGYCALTASDPREAIAVSDEHEGPIHLLLTDVVLPQMDGSTLFGKISSKRPEMKVLYMSGYTENFIVHHSVLDRGVHFIPKPFTVEELAAKIRRILDESQCGHLHHD
jgi:CheY-like chemotaxis protein/two-component sensor histidine kinase